jgi:5'-nucleotidase
MDRRLRIVVTNDDGVDSPGIHALARALHDAGHDLTVVAPSRDWSGAGASIGPIHLDASIEVTELEWDHLPGVPVYALDRPPATGVWAACLGAFGAVPDLIASGINPGANTGHLTLHSGTVGGALTGAAFGVAGIALSLEWATGEYHWETAARFAPAAAQWAIDAGDTMPAVLNINVPNRPFEEVLGVREAHLARYGEVWVNNADRSDGDLRLTFDGGGREPDPEADVALIGEGYVAVTPLVGIERAPLTGAADRVAAALHDGP